MLRDEISASNNLLTPKLNKKACGELNKLLANWIAKSNRPVSITEDEGLRLFIARLLEMVGSGKHFPMPSSQTNVKNLNILGAEGKNNARKFFEDIVEEWSEAYH